MSKLGKGSDREDSWGALLAVRSTLGKSLEPWLCNGRPDVLSDRVDDMAMNRCGEAESARSKKRK